MNPFVIVGLLAGVPLVLALVLRVSSRYLFASIAAGGLLVQYLADDAVIVVNTFLKNRDPTMAVRIGLLVLPVLLTMLFLRKTLKTSRLVLELLPLLASVAMLALLVLPHLPTSVQAQVRDMPYGNILHQSEDVVIGAAVILNLGLMWLLGKPHSDDHGGKSKKHH
jgi:hypothetical protein